MSLVRKTASALLAWLYGPKLECRDNLATLTDIWLRLKAEHDRQAALKRRASAMCPALKAAMNARLAAEVAERGR